MDSSREVWNREALDLAEMKDWPSLLAHCQKWTHVAPSDALAWDFFGSAYERLNQLDKAIDAYQQAVNLEPENVRFWCYLAVACAKATRSDSADWALKQALKLDPENPDAWINIGTAYNRLGRSHSAIQAFEKALSVRPNDPEVSVDVGYGYYNIGQYARALDLFQKELKRQLDASNQWCAANAWQMIGMATLELGNVQEAKQAFQETLRIRPDDAQAWHALGKAHLQEKDHDKALKAFEQAVAMDPTAATNWYALGMLHKSKGQPDKVREVYRKLDELNPRMAKEFFESMEVERDKVSEERSILVLESTHPSLAPPSRFPPTPIAAASVGGAAPPVTPATGARTTDRAGLTPAVRGWVYVISNRAMPRVVKVGFSAKDPELRARELDHTGSPHPYVVEYEMLIEHPYRIEQTVHRLLSKAREGKEWFRCDPEEAIATIQSVAAGNALLETFKRADREKTEKLRLQREAAKERHRKIAEIHARFEREVEQQCPRRMYWGYWLACTALASLLLFVLIPVKWISDLWPGYFWIATFLLGSLLAQAARRYDDSRRRDSPTYRSLLAWREAELESIAETMQQAD